MKVIHIRLMQDIRFGQRVRMKFLLICYIVIVPVQA
jgi:hypothetical protein